MLVVPLLMAGSFGLSRSPLQAQTPDILQDLESPIRPRSGVPCPSPDVYSPLRPDPAGVPTVVGLSLAFQDVAQLSDVDQTLTVDVYLLVRWRDRRLADPSRGDGSADCPMPGAELWMPAIEPDNLRTRQQFYQAHFLVDADGLVTVGRRFLVQVANPLDFRRFPVDTHRFRFTLWPVVSRSDEVRFVALNRFLSLNDSLTIHGWNVGTLTASASEGARVGRAGMFARYDATLEV
ncbi:MAG TPA: hypothetical protein VLD67_03835, partial [Vicinamibacterales bacterium]|nr:hypothetical protein [Vicinamibacterales bacterium]